MAGRAPVAERRGLEWKWKLRHDVELRNVVGGTGGDIRHLVMIY